MDKWERKCKKLCRIIVMRGGYCQRCGDPTKDWDLHHGLLKSSQRYILNPFLWYDPTLQFRLCNFHHLHASDAPHVDQGKFEDAMAVRAPDKIGRLIEVNSKPVPPAIDPRIVDWKLVYEHLVEFDRPLGNEILEGLG